MSNVSKDQYKDLRDKQLDKKILDWLEELDPLQKTHYSWPLQFELLSDKELYQKLLYQYVRLTHAVSLRGELFRPGKIEGALKDLKRAVTLCKEVNANTKPDIPASIGINYSVWHYFPKKLPPTDMGKYHKLEVESLEKRLKEIQQKLHKFNNDTTDIDKNKIAITAILFDSERFKIRKTHYINFLGGYDKRWNQAITDKYNAAYEVAERIFPNARIEWYARGAIHLANVPAGWDESPYFTLDEKGKSFSCSLYQVPEIGYTRETFRRTYKNAIKHNRKYKNAMKLNCPQVSPWIALACGYRRRTRGFNKFEDNWNYEPIYSWQLGREINCDKYGKLETQELYAPLNAAKIAVFFREPFYPPYWGKHFVAYVRGANSCDDKIKDIADLNTK